LETSVFEFHFLNGCCSITVQWILFKFAKVIIKVAKRIFNSDKICRSYCDFYFGFTFLEHTVLITNRKSHTAFRLVPTSMTLNGVIALLLLAITNPPCSMVSLR